MSISRYVIEDRRSIRWLPAPPRRAADLSPVFFVTQSLHISICASFQGGLLGGADGVAEFGGIGRPVEPLLEELTFHQARNPGEEDLVQARGI